MTLDPVEQASELAAQAEAIAGRLNDCRVNGELIRALGKVAYAEGRGDEACRDDERGVVEEESVMGPDDPGSRTRSTRRATSSNEWASTRRPSGSWTVLAPSPKCTGTA